MSTYILNEQGWEVPDQTPVAIPAYIKKHDQRDTIREMIRQQLSQEAQDNGYESFEEADDFDVGDDYEPSSPYEESFDLEGNSTWDYRPSEPTAEGNNSEPGMAPGTDGSIPENPVKSPGTNIVPDPL